MENQKPENKKLIFSSEQNNTQKRLDDKGLDLKLAQSDYKKGEDLNSEILSQMVSNLDSKEDVKSNTQLLKELSTYNEFDEDLNIQTDYSKLMKKRKAIYKKLFFVVLTVLVFVFSYWFQNEILNFSTDIFAPKDEVSSIDLSYKSEFLFTTLLNSSVINKQIAVLSLQYLENLKVSESVFKDEVQKKEAFQNLAAIKIELTNNFNRLKLNLLKSNKNNLDNKSVLIETINSSSDLSKGQKSDLVALLKYAPILNLLNKDYQSFNDSEFLDFLNSYLSLTNSIQLNNLAFIQSSKFNHNKFLDDLVLTLKNADSEFELFRTNKKMQLLAVNITPNSKQGDISLNLKLDKNQPLKDFLNIEESFLNSNNFKGDLSQSFNIESLSKDDFYSLNLKFEYI